MAIPLDSAHIQGLVTRSYSNLPSASYILYRMGDSANSNSWLARLIPRLTNAANKPEDAAVNLAFTPSGLKKLGLPENHLEMFTNEFVAGMTTPHRQRILGDTGNSAPDGWEWGGPRNEEVDFILCLFAQDDTGLAALYRDWNPSLAESGHSEIKKLNTLDIGENEHFGFRDGVSQPVIEGIGVQAPDWNLIKAGEFILGYPNEYNLYTNRPLLKKEEDPQNLLPQD